MAGCCRRLRSMMAQMRYYRHRQTIAVPVCLSLLAGVPLWPYPGLADNLIGAQAMGAAAGEGFGGSSELVDYRVMLRFDLLDPHALGENWLLESAVEVSLAYWQLDVPARKNYSVGRVEAWGGSVSPVFRLTAPGYWRPGFSPHCPGLLAPPLAALPGRRVGGRLAAAKKIGGLQLRGGRPGEPPAVRGPHWGRREVFPLARPVGRLQPHALFQRQSGRC